MSTVAVDYEKLTQSNEAPIEAFAFVGETEFAESTAESSSKRPVKILARTPNPINHWYWGRIVHDFDGMQRKPKVRLDYCHDVDECVGVAAKHVIDKSGLWLEGEVESLEEGDRASKILKEAAAGRPFEASISFASHDMQLEYVPENTTSKVNGTDFAGPGVIVRKWRLRACAICPHGYDADAKSVFSAGKLPAEHPVSQFQWKESPAMSKTAENNPGQQAAGETTDIAKLKADAAQAARDELKAQFNRFGEVFESKAHAYFNEGLSFEDACVKHIAELKTELVAANKAKADVEAKLAAVKTQFGENAIDTGNPATKSNSGPVKSISEARAKKTN